MQQSTNKHAHRLEATHLHLQILAQTQAKQLAGWFDIDQKQTPRITANRNRSTNERQQCRLSKGVVDGLDFELEVKMNT